MCLFKAVLVCANCYGHMCNLICQFKGCVAMYIMFYPFLGFLVVTQLIMFLGRGFKIFPLGLKFKGFTFHTSILLTCII